MIFIKQAERDKLLKQRQLRCDQLHAQAKYQLSNQILLRCDQIDEDLTARINMADYKFSFHEKGKEYSPGWLAPEGGGGGRMAPGGGRFFGWGRGCSRRKAKKLKHDL